MKIRHKLIIILISLTTIPLVFFSVLNYYTVRNSLKEQVLSGMRLIAEGKEGQILEYLESKRQRAVDFSSDGFLRKTVEQINQQKNIEEKKKLGRGLNNHFKTLKTIDSDILMIHILDPEGIFIGGDDEEYIGSDVDKNEPYFINGIKKTYIQVPHLHIHHEMKHHFIPVAVPFKGPDSDKVIGVLMIGYGLKDIKDILTDERNRKLNAYITFEHHDTNTDIYLINNDRTFIVPPKHLKDSEYWNIKSDTEPVSRCLNNGEEINREWTDLKGKNVWGASSCIQIEKDWRWALIVKQDKKVAMAPIVRLGNLYIIIGISFLLVAVLFALSIASAISKPIQALQKGTEIIGSGNLHHRVGMDSKDEVGDLSRAFDRMAENLKKTTASCDELRESEAKFKTLADSAQDAIIAIDNEGKISFANEATEKITGFLKDEIIGGDYTFFIPERDHEYYNREFLGFIQTGESSLIGRILEITGIKKDGSEFSAEISTSGFTIKGKQHILIILRDITERKKAEKEQRRSEKFIKDILESVDEGFIVIDPEYRIISANRAYSKQVKMPVEEIIGKHCYEISHHRDEPCFEAGEECAVMKTFETGEPYSAVHKHLDKEGNPVYAEMKSFPMKDERGRITSVIETINDITERVKLEEQLRHVQKMEALGTLSGGIAHDFNNILNVIIGFGTLIEMNMREDDPLRLHLSEIFKAAERATSLTQGLLAYSRKQRINPEPVNLNDIIKRVEKFLSRLIGEDIDLQIKLTEEDITVFADAGQMEMVLMNLATNARDAMPKGGTLSIRSERAEFDREYTMTHAYAKPGQYGLISVSDTGFGMDNRTKERIFEPFFTTKDIGKGTGLGLATVYGIIKQHKGYINLYSEPDKGTVFKIYLPLIKSEKTEVSEEAQEIVPTLMRGTETILITEDDQAIRKFTRELLQQAGYNVIEAIDGSDAINKFIENSDKVQLILMDVIMPKKSGKEAYEKIRETRSDIKAIFVSGYASDIIREQGMLDEDITFIYKPVSPIELLRKIREVLDK